MAMYPAVHGPMPGSARSRPRGSSLSTPGSSTSDPSASAATSAVSVRARGCAAAPGRPGRAPPAPRRGEQVGQAAVRVRHRLAVRRDQPAGVRAGRRASRPAGRARPAPRTRRRRRDRAPGGRAPCRRAGRAADRRRAARRPPPGRRRGRAAGGSADGDGEVAQVGEARAGRRRGRRSGSGRRRRAVRQPQRAAVGAVPHSSTPGTARGGEVPKRSPGRAAPGTAAAADTRRAPPARQPRAGRGPAARAGELANTSRTVSLNWRTLENPAANATSAIGRSVVSISSRAVCARWARARASGPAPSSATSSRFDLAGGCSRAGGPGPPRPPGRRPRRRSAAWPGRRRRPACSTRASRAWRRAGTACRPGTRPAGRRRRRVEAHVLALRRDGRAARAAVDAGGDDGGEEPAVEAGVPALHRPVAALLVLEHATIMPCSGTVDERKSDIAYRSGRQRVAARRTAERRPPTLPAMELPELTSISVGVATAGTVVTITFARPERLNVLSRTLLGELVAVCRWLDGQRDIKVALVRGALAVRSRPASTSPTSQLRTPTPRRETRPISVGSRPRH